MPEKLNAGGNVLSWATELDWNTIEQATRTSKLPILAGHLALMPDAHFGLGATVGSVIPTRGAIIPAAVGVDIGCGMIAVETSLTSSALPETLDTLMPLVEKYIPAGVGKGHESTGQVIQNYGLGSSNLTQKQEATANNQLGTLGSGNHFVEVCLDERDVVWVVLHSGSRGIGNQLAKVHIDTAKGVMAQYFIQLEDKDLAYFVEGTSEFQRYINDLLWAQKYALANREVMMNQALRALELVTGSWSIEERRINCHHNYSEKGEDGVWITRKGAIKADVGDLGVIPGSMGTRSYIVEGLGNRASYCSASHGAGRVLSRSAAKATLDIDGLRAAMAGKTWNEDRAQALLDEDPRSYKDIDVVMENQKDLVKILHTLHQIFNYKG